MYCTCNSPTFNKQEEESVNMHMPLTGANYTYIIIYANTSTFYTGGIIIQTMHITSLIYMYTVYPKNISAVKKGESKKVQVAE